MASVNKVMILGNLGKDPEVRYTSDERAIANISVATTSKYKDKAGELKEDTEWHRVVFFNRLAEVVRDYLKKGQPVFVEGKLQTRKWQDQSGQDRYTTEIVAENMQMLSSKGDITTNFESSTSEKNSSGSMLSPQKEKIKSENVSAKGFEDLDDDIPF